MQENQTNWHSLEVQEVLKKLNTTHDGLDSKEASKRFKIFGPNEIEQKKPISSWDLFVNQFKSPLIYLLVIVAVITFVLKKYVDSIVISAIVFINTLVAWLQEVKAEKSLDAIKKLITLKCIVVRDSEEKEILSQELIPGDIVILSGGQKIPADIRLIKVEELQVDESNLTGESTTVRKNIEILENSTTLADRKNMVYASTIITSGKGVGVVVETANNTEIGKIAKKVITTKDDVSTINQRIIKLGKIILYAIIIICICIFFLGIFRKQEIINMFLTTISVAVSAIPEGLPALITVVLAVGVQRMVKRNALVRKMQSIETLGNINIIASDKTGTLTLNQMFAEKIYLSDGNIVTIDGKGYEPSGNFYLDNVKIDFKKNKLLSDLLFAGLLCNDATLINKEKRWLLQGDPTEGALIVLAAKAQMTKPNTIDNFPRIDEIQFNSQIGYMATLNKKPNNNFLAVKGKIEVILGHCSHYIDKHGDTIKLSILKRKDIESQAISEAKKAYRILAIAKKDNLSIKTIEQSNINNLIYLGFICLDDPPKIDAIEAIGKCKLSGITPIMITGDHPETALAIAKKMKIAKSENEIITGQQLEKLNSYEFSKITDSTTVFARVTPEIKYKIVESLQKKGNIVGVTGDGINDAPVLKKANVGIAMGIGGTDVAREASDIILLDNNFSTIVAAIEEGRTIFLNIKRIIFYLLSTNLGEILIVIIALVLNLPLALSATQILWINLVTDVTGGMALAMEPKHKSIDAIKPSEFKTGFIDNISGIRMILVSITMAVGTIYIYKMMLSSGSSIELARSMTFITMVLFQVFNVYNARSMTTSIFKLNFLSNIYIIPLTIISIILTIFTTQLEWFRNLLNTRALSLENWIMAICVSLTIILIVEIDKALRK